MMERNCVNCGAVIESHADKCPYCGTSYFDFTNVDVGNHKPVVLKLAYNGKIFALKAVCTSCDISIESTSPTIYVDHTSMRLTPVHSDITVNIEFQGVGDFT